jgi:hypothetical protein
MGGAYLLYATTIFLSALLLFSVEPIAGKYVLPWFGGSSSVWATSLLFFTGMLFFGYLYVFILTRASLNRQVTIHAAVIVLIAAYTVVSLVRSHAPYPPLDWTVGNAASPYFNVLRALFAAIGGPFFLLSTTGPLLQYWYGTSANREPYKLYAFSNAGSLLALIGYMTLIEPGSTLHVQENVWLVLFFLAVLLTLFVAFFFRGNPKTEPRESDATMPGTRTLLSWLALAALPTFMLVATTTDITQKIAPVPLLWVIPLSIYLFTLILAFAGFGQSRYVPLIFFAAATWAYLLTPGSSDTVLYTIAAYLLLLFFCGLCCHARLYALRPQTGRLPLFYLFLSLGGMLGTLGASILAPLIFKDFWEFPLGIALSGCVAFYLLSDVFFPRILDEGKIKLTKLLFVFVAAALFTNVVLADGAYPFALNFRNFYGVAQVGFGDGFVALSNGTTLHGLQYTDPAKQYEPTTYYTSDSGVGRAVTYEEAIQKGSPLRVGVVGLGAGVLAAYCRPGDAYVFYEIDPKIVSIARTYFSFLSHCAGSEVRLGDARQVLQEEALAGKPGKYDILAVDAFNDDTIPVHLLTLQAFELYEEHLRSPQSVIAIDVSNRYLDLAPVVFRIAAESGFSATEVYAQDSVWVVLSKDPAIFRSSEFKDANTSLPKPSSTIWTDDYTSIFSVLNLPY